MKNIVLHSLIMLCLCFNLNALQGQALNLDQKIQLSINEVNAAEALEALKQKTGFDIAYNNQLLNLKKKRSWRFDLVPIKKVLQSILKPEGLSYRVLGSRVLVYEPSAKKLEEGIKDQFEMNQGFSGQIIDAQTKEPVYFAHLIVEGTSLGSVANEQGKFNLKIPPVNLKKNLLISAIGYGEASVPILSIENGIQIELLPVTVDLETFTIQEKKIEIDPRAIVAEAIQRIPENYPNEATKMDVYYRELTKTNGIYTKFADASAELSYTPYSKAYNAFVAAKKYNDYSAYSESKRFAFSRAFSFYPSHLDQAKVIEARGSDNLQRYEELAFLDNKWEIEMTQDLLSRDIGGGPLRMTAYDHVKHLNHLFSATNFSEYRFELIEITQDGTDYVYRIQFSPRRKKFKKARYEGEIIIDYNTKAIRGLEYTIASFAKKKLKRLDFTIIFSLNRKFKKKHKISRKRLKIRTYPDSLHIAVAYFPYQGRWYLKRISESYNYQNEFLKEGESTYHTRCDLVVNDIQLGKVDSIPKKDQFRSIVSNYLFYYPLSYNPVFWQGYPALITDKVTEEAMQDLEQTHSLEEQFASRFQYDSTLKAPIAEIKPQISYLHGQEIIDDYHWLKNRDSDASYDYIQAENEYTRNYLLPHRSRQRELYYEMVDKVEKNFNTLPTKIGDYYYGYRFEEGLPYEIYWRKEASLDNPETIILDVNKLAKDYAYYSVDGISISPNNKILAYIENLTGGLENTVHFKRLDKEQLLLDSLQNVGTMVWAENSSIIYYTQADTSKRQFQLYRYQLEGNLAPELIYEEKDKRFAIDIAKSKSKDFLILSSASKNENEQYILDANNEQATLQLVKKREKGWLYWIEHYQDYFYLFSNHENPDYALYRSQLFSQESLKKWQALVNYGSDTLLMDFEIVGDYLILEQRINMRPIIAINNIKTGETQLIEHPDKELGFMSAFSINKEATDAIYLSFSSPTSPPEIYKYDLVSGQKSLVKHRKVLGTYEKEDYKTQRLWASSNDGTRIPITLIYKKQETPLKERPIHVMGYGAYGINNTADFSVAHIPFMDQGGIIAYPHIRGGSELGEKWYQSGKLLCKKHSFQDFITAVEYLTQQGYADPDQVYASGGSAGGLLMGAVINARPDLFKAVALQVPFVDVLNTMLDSNLTLTTLEYQEWGNPNNPQFFEYIQSYSPYDNVKAQEYPNLLFMSAYNDGVVGYWEAAKMVAKLRAMKTDDKVLLLQTQMNAGHLGAAGRYEYYKQLSMIYTFFETLN